MNPPFPYALIYGNGQPPLTIDMALTEVLNNKEFLSGYDRLNNSDVFKSKTPIIEAVDWSSGYKQHSLSVFFEFFVNVVWMPLVSQHVEEGGHLAPPPNFEFPVGRDTIVFTVCND